MHQEETNQKKGSPLVVGVIGAAVMLVTLGAGCAQQPVPPVTVDTGGTGDVEVQVLPTPAPSSEPPTPTPTPAPAPAPTPSQKSSYKDGTYTAKGQYAYHSGTEEVTIGLTIKNDIVVDTTFQAVPSVPMSGRFQQLFSDNYKTMVVGKNIADVCALGKVSGSSLTPNGFNAACLKIQAQAKA